MRKKNDQNLCNDAITFSKKLSINGFKEQGEAIYDSVTYSFTGGEVVALLGKTLTELKQNELLMTKFSSDINSLLKRVDALIN